MGKTRYASPMKQLCPVIILLCAGCATSVESLRLQGDRRDYRGSQSVQETAACVTRGVESFHAVFIADRSTNGDVIEIVVRHPVNADIQAIFEMSPSTGGTRLTAWRSWFGPFPEFTERVTGACRTERVTSP